jgi:membrane-associated protein
LIFCNTISSDTAIGRLGFMLLLGNAGVPVPGETTLLFAGYLAKSQHQLYLPMIIVSGVAAAVSGDNVGYALGHFGGRRLLNKYLHFLHVRQETVDKGKHFFKRYGAVTIFFARFLAGLRVIAGPLAGTLGMTWRKFLLSNFLGAVAWVCAVACAGYFFGTEMERLLQGIRHLNLMLLGAALLAGAVWWWRRRTHASQS